MLALNAVSCFPKHPSFSRVFLPSLVIMTEPRKALKDFLLYISMAVVYCKASALLHFLQKARIFSIGYGRHNVEGTEENPHQSKLKRILHKYGSNFFSVRGELPELSDGDFYLENSYTDRDNDRIGLLIVARPDVTRQLVDLLNK